MSERDITESQRHILSLLTDARCANLFQLADLIGDMNADGLEFLRRLGDPRYEALTSFLSHARPETLNFLTEARDFEIKKLQEGLRMVVAFQAVGRATRAGIVFLFGAFVGTALIWDKVSAWLKSR